MISSVGSSYGTSSTSWSSYNQQAKKAAPSAAELFASTDADGDGQISQTELSSALESRGQSSGSSGSSGIGLSAEELFSSLDLNGDGSITEQEHEDALETMAQKLEAKASMTRIAMESEDQLSASELFSSTDADGDGVITLAELEEALASRQGEGAGEGEGLSADELFAYMDADGDGSVTETEHAEALASMSQNASGAQVAGGAPAAGGAGGGSSSSEEEEEDYEDADLNQDGVVTMEEMAEYLGVGNSEEDSTLESLFAALDNANAASTSGSTTEEENTDMSAMSDFLQSIASSYGSYSKRGATSTISQMA